MKVKEAWPAQRVTYKYRKLGRCGRTLINLILFFRMWVVWKGEDPERYLDDGIDAGKYSSDDILHK